MSVSIFPISLHFYSSARLGPQLLLITKAKAAASKVYEIIRSMEKEDENGEGEREDPNEIDMNIQFKNVTFSYPGR